MPFECVIFRCNLHNTVSVRTLNLKTQQPLAILDLCLSKTQEGKYHNNRNVIVFEKLYFQNVLRPH